MMGNPERTAMGILPSKNSLQMIMAKPQRSSMRMMPPKNSLHMMNMQ